MIMNNGNQVKNSNNDIAANKLNYAQIRKQCWTSNTDHVVKN